jgi:hypothetical protein
MPDDSAGMESTGGAGIGLGFAPSMNVVSLWTIWGENDAYGF